MNFLTHQIRAKDGKILVWSSSFQTVFVECGCWTSCSRQL